MTIPENQILETEVSMTILGGKLVYQNPEKEKREGVGSFPLYSIV